MHILFRGREYVIDARLRNRQFRLKDVATGEFHAEAELTLVDGLFDGQAEFLGYGGAQTHAARRVAAVAVQDLAILRDDDPKQRARKEEARRRYRYVNEVLVRGVRKLTKASLGPIIADVAKRFNDPTPPCWSTLYNWVRAYRRAGEDVRVLIPAWNNRGGTKPRCSGMCVEILTDRDRRKAEEVNGLIDEVINERYVSPQRLSVVGTYKLVDAQIRAVNRMRREEDRLPIPHLNTLYKRIRKLEALDGYEVDRARHGQRYADNKHGQTGKYPRPARPLERVQIDHTRTDLMVVDMDRGLPVGRATLTNLIDDYTKMIPGSYLGFEPASYLTVMQALLNAIRPKTYVKKLYPEVENDWECYGIPETIVCDNGREFHSADFVDACLQMGIAVEYAPPGRPQFKASIERHFGSLNTQLLHATPGTTWSNLFQKGDYDPHKNAVIDIKELHTIHHLYMVDIYPRQYHKGIRDVPARLWQEGVMEYPPRLPRKGTDLRVLLGKVVYRVVTREGVELFGLFYNDERLGEIRQQLRDGKKAMVKYDPTDLGQVYVADPESGDYITARAVDYEYSLGLSEYQHDVIRRHAREIAEDYVDADSLAKARAKVQEIVDRAWERSRKTGTASRLARFKQYGQEYVGRVDDTETNAEVEVALPAVEVVPLNPGVAAVQSGVSDLPSDLPGRAVESPEDEEPEGSIDDSEDAPARKPRGRPKKKGASESRKGIEELADEDELDEVEDPDEDDPDDESWGSDYDGELNEEEE
jgi:putative transposase